MIRIATLTGRWLSTRETFERLYEFKPLDGGIVVSVSDSADGELYVVMNERHLPSAILFDLAVPSSGATTKNRITIENSEPVCSITYGEIWVRKSLPRERIRTSPKRRAFLGEWTEENNEVAVLLRFKPHGRGVRIEVQNMISGETLKVRKPRWSGSTVSFCCCDSNGLPQSRHKFSLSERSKALHLITLKDHLRRASARR